MLECNEKTDKQTMHWAN